MAIKNATVYAVAQAVAGGLSGTFYVETIRVTKAAVTDCLENYCARFQALHSDRRADGTPRPHKAVMLLSVLSLADNGQLTTNRIVYGPDLLELFKRFFAIVRQPTDQCTPWNPFFYLRREQFWHLLPLPGKAEILKAIRAPTVGSLLSMVAHASLDEKLFALVTQPVSPSSSVSEAKTALF